MHSIMSGRGNRKPAPCFNSDLIRRVVHVSCPEGFGRLTGWSGPSAKGRRQSVGSDTDLC